MQFLLDTHTFIWFINGDKNLPSKVRNEIENINNRCYISIGSIWEIAIKTSLGRLNLKSDFNKITYFLFANEIEVLPISFEHIQQLLLLHYFHRDPFDRMIIAQSIIENITIITKDENFKNYDVKTLWD